ncbi:hypothetical protein ACN27E_03490 [Mycobacterium sp. WMMD1722]|uniref:hypothetical protein n=1 Tax=Mycobacterium sp. WMMD1722 TaxID=3404117 RepID=UPI003BF484E9
MKPSRGRHRKKRRCGAVGTGGAFAAAAVSGALVAGTINTAPAANASCISVFGFGNGNGCTSNPTSIAIGLGDGASADASFGYFSSAIALGNNARSTAALSLFTFATAVGDSATTNALFSIFSLLGQVGAGTTSVIGGPNLALGLSNSGGASGASVTGGFNVVVQVGPGSSAAIGGSNLVIGIFNGSGEQASGSTGASGFGNIAVQLGPGSTNSIGGFNLGLGVSPLGSGTQNTTAGIFGTLALNLLTNGEVLAQGALSTAVAIAGDSKVEMSGILTSAVDILGNQNVVTATGPRLLSGAFSVLGNRNTVTAGPGPFSFAGSVLQNGATVEQTGPGVAFGAVFSPQDDPPEQPDRPVIETTRAATASTTDGAFRTTKPAITRAGAADTGPAGVTTEPDSGPRYGRHSVEAVSERMSSAGADRSPGGVRRTAAADDGPSSSATASTAASSPSSSGVSAGADSGGRHRAGPKHLAE